MRSGSSRRRAPHASTVAAWSNRIDRRRSAGSPARTTSPCKGWARRTDSRRPSVRIAIRPSRSSSSRTVRPAADLELAEADRLAQRQQLEHGASRRVEPAETRLDHLAETASARRAARRGTTRRRAGRGAAAPAHRAPAPAAPGRCPGWPPTTRPTRWRRGGPPARCATTCRRRAGRARRGRSASPARRATTGSPSRAPPDRRPPWRCRTARRAPSRRSIIVSDVPSSRWASSSNSTGTPASPADRGEHSAGGVEQLGERDGVDRILVAERGQRAGRHQVGDRAERDRPRRAVGRRPQHPPPAGLGHVEALVAETRLAHPGRPVDAERLAPRIGERHRERIKLVTPADQGPPCRDGHRRRAYRGALRSLGR